MMMERPAPPIDSCVSLFHSALNLYTIWLVQLAGHETRLRTSTLIRDSLTAWYGGPGTVPLDLSTALYDDRQHALQDLQDSLAQKPKVQHHLTTAQEAVQDTLQMFPLTTAQRSLLQNCAATLERCDLNNPGFPLPL
jgi:hypothetical protein